MSEYCTICNEIKGISNVNQDKEYSNLIKTKENIIFKSENFSVIPSIGAINPFHILIVTNKCMNSFAHLNKDKLLVHEYKNIENFIRDYNSKFFNLNTIVFEHGTGVIENNGGSSIFHAHMHVIAVPQNIVFLDMLEILNLNLIKIPIEDYNILLQRGYLYFKDDKKNEYLNYTDKYSSQVLRKYTSSLLGKSMNWDWKSFKNYENVEKVIQNYSELQNYISLKI